MISNLVCNPGAILFTVINRTYDKKVSTFEGFKFITITGLII